MGFSQPAIAGGILFKGTTLGSYSPSTFGLTAQFQTSPGVWSCILDQYMPKDTFIVQGTARSDTGAPTFVSIEPFDGGFEVFICDKSGNAVDEGAMVTVYPVPLTR